MLKNKSLKNTSFHDLYKVSGVEELNDKAAAVMGGAWSITEELGYYDMLADPSRENYIGGDPYSGSYFGILDVYGTGTAYNPGWYDVQYYPFGLYPYYTPTYYNSYW